MVVSLGTISFLFSGPLFYFTLRLLKYHQNSQHIGQVGHTCTGPTTTAALLPQMSLFSGPRPPPTPPPIGSSQARTLYCRLNIFSNRYVKEQKPLIWGGLPPPHRWKRLVFPDRRGCRRGERMRR